MNIEELKNNKRIVQMNIDEMSSILHDIEEGNWSKEQLETYLSNILRQNIEVKKQVLKKIDDEILNK